MKSARPTLWLLHNSHDLLIQRIWNFTCSLIAFVCHSQARVWNWRSNASPLHSNCRKANVEKQNVYLQVCQPWACSLQGLSVELPCCSLCSVVDAEHILWCLFASTFTCFCSPNVWMHSRFVVVPCAAYIVLSTLAVDGRMAGRMRVFCSENSLRFQFSRN